MTQTIRSLALLLATTMAVAMPRVALAHAFPKRAQPAIGGTVSSAPATLRIWFTEKLEPDFSKVEVRDAAGAEVDKGDAKVDAQDPSLLSVSLKPLPSGTYKVTWHAVSTDTHPTRGDFTFTVK